MPDLEPITRLEEYLSKLAGDDVAVPEPITRVEKFLAYIAGEADSKPTPITRIEKFLDAIGQGGGGGGGGETVIVPEQTIDVEFDGDFYYAEGFTATELFNDGDTYTVTFDGVDYTLQCVTGELGEFGGDSPDFTNYPFVLGVSSPDDDVYDGYIYTETAGTYTVKVTKSGGASAVIIEKNITANGTYNASSDSADGYNPVNVSVPNSYSAGDEGKVVSSGALVSQTAATYTANSVYDTTLIDEVTVNVSGGGSNPFTLLYEDEVTVNTSSTTESTVKDNISVDFSAYYNAYSPTHALVVITTDKAGHRTGYLYQTMQMCYIASAVGAPRTSIVAPQIGMTTSAYGVYVYVNSLANNLISIRAKYNSSYGTIDGTYSVKVYAVDLSAL